MNHKKHIFISGVSSGIGKALAELCKEKGFSVHGIGRNFGDLDLVSRYEIDFENVAALEKFEFPKIDAADEIILVNNAGTIGEINKIAQSKQHMEDLVFKVNTISPMILMRKFVQTYQKERLSIINISSGAGKRPISGWSAYCSSKAALDMYSLVLQEEELERKSNIKVHAFSPGVVDTNMQDKIRTSTSDEFSNIQHFKDLKENKLLRSPQQVAKDILTVLNNDYPVILSSSDLH